MDPAFFVDGELTEDFWAQVQVNFEMIIWLRPPLTSLQAAIISAPPFSQPQAFPTEPAPMTAPTSRGESTISAHYEIYSQKNA
jgi:hypothetical protein